ncbi:MAG: hypothetical protein ABJZ62_05800 [Hyphomicrobiales bacterium]
MSKKCVFCGINDATTTDHIPPKSVFRKEQRKNSLTVPACNDCNCASNIDDETFKVVIGLIPNSASSTTNQSLMVGVSKTLGKNNQLTRNLFKNSTAELVLNKFGFSESSPVLHYDTEAIERVAIKIGKALYFKEKGKTPYEDKIEVEILWNTYAIGMEPAPLDVATIKNNTPLKDHNDGHFKYWFTPNVHQDFDLVPVAIFDQVVFIVKYIKLI